MFIIIGESIVNFDNVKSFTKRADHIIIEFNDKTSQEFVFNSEPEARDAFVKLAQSTATAEVETGEALYEHPALLIADDNES